MPISRKKFLQQSAAMLGGVALGNKLFASKYLNLKQVPDTFHPMDCTWNFASQYIYLNPNQQIDSATFSYFKTSSAARDVQYDTEYDVFECDPGIPGIYKCDVTDRIESDPWLYTAYFPKATVHDYTLKPLPIVVLFHAGGYSDCAGSFGGSTSQIVTLAKSMAAKGYICISVE